VPKLAEVTTGGSGRVAGWIGFGTSDLVQADLRPERDEIGSFLPAYLEKGRAVAKDQKKALKLGVCVEHGGDLAPIGFFQKCGLDYVGGGPFRMPVAPLAAAQAATWCDGARERDEGARLAARGAGPLRRRRDLRRRGRTE
jgi:pyruvate, orthophosphate dikinase